MDGLEPGGSLARLLAWRSEERPGHPFLWVEEEGPWTIGGLAAAAREVAGRLESAGVAAGDRVLVRVGNDSRFLPALTAVWLRGAAAVVMHPGAPADDVVAVVDAMTPAAVVAPEEDTGRGAPAVPCIALSPPPIEATAGSGVSLESPGPGTSPESQRREVSTMTPPPEALTVPACSDGDTALILLTSGSTGRPKGVALSHGAAWANLAATVSAFRRDTRPAPIPDEPKPPNLIANPFSHTAGIVRLLFALYVGRSVVVLRKFDAAAARAAVIRHGIDHLTLNPTMLRMLLHDLPPDAGLGVVRYVSSGTAPLPPALREAFEARFGVPVIGAYGQTEAFGGIAVEKVGDVLAGRRRPGSVGKPLSGVEVRIVTADGREATAGDQGEIWARSAAVTTGYVGGATGDGPPVDSDGWLHTGDLGHLDDDGYLFITGRLRNIIICGGFNVVPEEVEARLLDDPAVRDAAVVALPDERLGEIPVALVETDDDGDAVLERVGPRLAAYKRPRLLFAVATLPRVTNGKVDQAATRRLAAGLAGVTVP